MLKKIIRIVRGLVNRFGFDIKKSIEYSNDTADYIRLFGDDSVKYRRFYNISVGVYKGFGGGINHPCWTNVDVDKAWKGDKCFPNGKEYDPNKDIAHDLLSMAPLPIESATAELVHSRFTVDRLTDDAALFFFKEVFRILKPGGVFRVISTDVDLDYRAYLNNDKDYYFWLSKDYSIEQMFLYHVVTQLSSIYSDNHTYKLADEDLRGLFSKMPYEDALDYCVSKCSLEIQKNNRYDHFNWWNQKKFEKMLSNAGFKEYFRSAPGQSSVQILRNEAFFDNEHLKVMMYMEAIKN